MLRFLLKHRVTATYIPRVLVHMRTGGSSNASWGLAGRQPHGSPGLAVERAEAAAVDFHRETPPEK